MKISIVSPVYRAEGMLTKLVQRIESSVNLLADDYEIILVNDCSPDNSWNEIKGIAAANSCVKGVNFSKNFGQHYAISAGLTYATGEWVVVMDCDLQDQPEEIGKLYKKALEGYDVVLAKREQRQDKFFKKVFSKLFYGLLSYLTGVKHDPSIANFGIYHNKVISNVNNLPESIRYFPTMVKWVGFNQTAIHVAHAERESGTSSYNWSTLVRLAIDIILAYSDKPLRITMKVGFTITLISLFSSIVVFIQWFRGSIKVLGYTSVVLSVWLLSGLIIFILGVMGLYIGKMFEGIKKRPIFIVKETTWQ
jgi:polyisoprenyl-phosphate glycosyltransferase